MRILVVDDAEDVRFTLSRILQRMGHLVEEAEDGEQAWNILQEESFHVIVSDWMMPKVDGLELCRRVRKNSFNNYIYIILLTGMSDIENLVVGLDSGADDFARKPYTPSEMRVRLNSAQRVIDLEESLETKRKRLESTYQDLVLAHDVINRDLQHASILQKSMLPQTRELPGSSVDWYFSPAIHIGGDTLNYEVLNSNLFFFYSIDVSGHGVSSALLSISLHTMLNLLLKDYQIEHGSEDDVRNIPLDIVNSLNKKFTEGEDVDHYFTMFCGVYDVQKKNLHFVQAGHPFPVILRKNKNEAEVLDCTGFPVGLTSHAEYEVGDVSIEEGDRFMIYSDGILELEEDEKALTEDWLKNSLENVASFDLKESINYFGDKISNLIGEAEQPDDVSFLLFEFN